MRLTDKVAIVTGSASGIGKEIAHTFAKAGAKVVIADLDLSKAQAVAEELNKQDFKALAVKMDVTQENEVKSAIDKVVTEFKTVDILVSNAGIQTIASIDELSFSDWKKMLAIHLDGAFLTTKECLKVM